MGFYLWMRHIGLSQEYLDMITDKRLSTLEEIMSSMDGGEVVVVFAGYTKSMKMVIDANEGLRRRVTNLFNFDDYSPLELAEILHSKITKAGNNA